MITAEEARRLADEVNRRKQVARLDTTFSQPRQDWESSLQRRPRKVAPSPAKTPVVHRRW